MPIFGGPADFYVDDKGKYYAQGTNVPISQEKAEEMTRRSRVIWRDEKLEPEPAPSPPGVPTPDDIVKPKR